MLEKTYGYVRVSTKGQKEDRQLIAMREFGVPEDHIIVEKQSGKDFDRPAYCQLVQALESGDILVVKSIDRLGRNYKEILEQWAGLTKERGIAVVVLDMPLLDTRADRDLTGVLVADIVLQILSYVAQTERDFIRQRQAEGIAAAKAKGVKFGGMVVWPHLRRPGREGAGHLPHDLQTAGGGVVLCRGAGDAHRQPAAPVAGALGKRQNPARSSFFKKIRSIFFDTPKRRGPVRPSPFPDGWGCYAFSTKMRES